MENTNFSMIASKWHIIVTWPVLVLTDPLVILQLQSFQWNVWQHAPVDHRGVVCAAARTDPSPPAGLPQSGSEVGGADEEGGGAYRCDWHSEEGQLCERTF